MKITTLFCLFFLEGCGSIPNNPLPPLPFKFSDIQKQTLTPSCAYSASCHADSTSIGPFLDLAEGASYYQLLNHQKDWNGKSFTKLVVPFNPDSSFLVYKLTRANGNADYGVLMPKTLPPLPQNQIDAIINWIKAGAQNN